MAVLSICRFDGWSQKNEVWAYGQVGKNTISQFYQALNAFYTRSVTDRVSLMGGFELNSKKDGFGGLLA